MSTQALRRRRLDDIEGVELNPVRASSNRAFQVLAALAVIAAAVLRLAGVNLALAAVGSYLAFVVLVHLVYRVRNGGRVAADKTAKAVLYGTFIVAIVPLVSLLGTVIASGGATAVNPDYLLTSMRGVTGVHDRATVEEGAPLIGGAYHAIIGTLIITGLAALISVPIGLFTAVFLVEYRSKGRLATAIRFLVDVMTGIPSIVAGLFAFALWAVLFGVGTKNGFSGAVALSVLMIPTVVRSAEEMLRIVPNELREAALALGVPKWRTIVRVVLPTAASGLAAGVTLAIARVVGETAPLLVAVGVTQGINVNPGDGPMNTLAVYAYNLFKYPRNPGYPDPSLDRAWAAAFLLILVVVLLNLSARLIARFFAPKTTG
ncbi:MAG: phosphate ABC transporter permease PstA [Actinomycetales bacterium]|nr:phosphate ABC transporter permease PstA [Actinomycetales bacterium]